MHIAKPSKRVISAVAASIACAALIPISPASAAKDADTDCITLGPLTEITNNTVHDNPPTGKASTGDWYSTHSDFYDKQGKKVGVAYGQGVMYSDPDKPTYMAKMLTSTNKFTDGSIYGLDRFTYASRNTGGDDKGLVEDDVVGIKGRYIGYKGTRTVDVVNAKDIHHQIFTWSFHGCKAPK